MGKHFEENYFVIEKNEMVNRFVESYRSKLVGKYKEMIFTNWDEQRGLDLTDELMQEAVMIMKASADQILKMFFEDEYDKYLDSENQGSLDLDPQSDLDKLFVGDFS